LNTGGANTGTGNRAASVVLTTGCKPGAKGASVPAEIMAVEEMMVVAPPSSVALMVIG